ncbi:GTPase [Verrucomicrobium spinosum]|uniref:GTPase n=1 Tax=Verrucomicrobium spinosum TaxID=2736 RepID=UPI003CCD9985
MESAGKSALFRGLTGHAAGDEANYRGSTVVCRRCRVPDCTCEVVDTPGIRTVQMPKPRAWPWLRRKGPTSCCSWCGEPTSCGRWKPCCGSWTCEAGAVPWR